jgi:hypothetical protein
MHKYQLTILLAVFDVYVAHFGIEYSFFLDAFHSGKQPTVVLTMRNRQSVVVHSWQDFFGQVVVEAQLMLRGRKAEIRRPPSARDEPAQLLSCLFKKCYL